MMRSAATLLTLCVFTASSRADESIVAITADPATVRLIGPQASFTLLVHGTTAAGKLIDLTRSARYQVRDGKVAQVGSTGSLRPVTDGSTEVIVEANGHRQLVRVEVAESARPRVFHFENDIVPILSRFGCNSAGCHGGAEGQNGFKLSVFGFDPGADYTALVKDGRGRRVLHEAPDASLLLAKASGQIAHGGGVRIPRGTPEYDTLRGWIAAGTPLGDPKTPHIVAIRVEPRQRLLAMKGQQQLRVIGRYGDGREIDVTGHAKFQSNQEGIASVAVDGLVSAGDVPGEVAVMATYLGAVDTFRALVPRAGKIDPYPAFPANNFIDGFVLTRLKDLNIAPSDLADDADYLRRVYLDVMGTLPTAGEARRFLTDQRADRRARLVDELLERPEYADYWALQWADVLRVDRQALGHKRAYAFYRWIRASIAQNKPFDQFAASCSRRRGRWRKMGRPASTRSRSSRVRRPARWRRSSSACGSRVLNATTTRSTAGARPTTSACRRSSRSSASSRRSTARRWPWPAIPRHATHAPARSFRRTRWACRSPIRRRKGTAGSCWRSG